MSDLKPEVIEPGPSATTTANNETVNKSGVDGAAPTDAGLVKGDTEGIDTKDESKSEATDKHERKPHENRRGGRGGRDNFSKRDYSSRREKSKSKFDPSSLEQSDDPVKIRGQMEFYFGDSNLPQDKLLWELTDGTDNKPVSLKFICEKFNRMKRFQPYETVVKALQQSEFLNITGEEGEEMVSRKNGYNPRQGPQHENRMNRSVYVKGFGDEKPSSQFDIEAFFSNYGPTNFVKLRRNEDDRSFKGSVFCEFSNQEDADKFLALDPKPQWEGADFEEISSKSAYVEKKNEMIKNGEMQPNETRHWKKQTPRGDFKSGGGRDRRGGDRDPNDWKKRREDDQRNGFKDDRRGGGRGRGRGGRGGRDRDDRGSRKNGRDEERAESKDDGDAKVEPEVKENNKRAREDDVGGDEAPAKKAKEEAVAA